ncbi:MAG: ribosome recycling factor [Candidatus Borkfalkia sp.]
MEEILLVLEERLEKTFSVLKENYASVRAGRANPHILDKVLVDYYGTMSPLNQGATFPFRREVPRHQPVDVSLLKGIEKAIIASNIGINPTNDGKVIRLVFPDLTEERRRELAKQIKAMSEESKVAARNVRRDAMEALKKLKNNKEISEDECAGVEKDVEKTVSKCIEQIEKCTADKEKEILSV